MNYLLKPLSGDTVVHNSPRGLGQRVCLDTSLNEVNSLRSADVALQFSIFRKDGLKRLQRLVRADRLLNCLAQLLGHAGRMSSETLKCPVDGRRSAEFRRIRIGLEFDKERRKNTDALKTITKSISSNKLDRIPHRVRRRDAGVASWGRNIDSDVEVALLANCRNCENAVILLRVSSYKVRVTNFIGKNR